MKKIFSILLALVLVLSFSLVMAVPVAAAEEGIINVPDDYDTIQAAIDAANSGNTILVEAGTYTENVVIPPDKDNLQLIGAGSGETFITPASGKPVLLKGWDMPSERPLNSFRIQGFTLVTADASHAILAGSGTADGSYYTTNLELEDIVVDGGQLGIGLNSVNGVTLTNVHLSNISGSPEAALELTGVFGLTFVDGSIVGNDIGVRLQPGLGSWGDYGPNGDIQIHFSSLVSNTIAIENRDGAVVIDATNNWWSDASGPSGVGSGTGDAVSEYVDYEPWLTAAWPPPPTKADILKDSGIPGKGLDKAPGLDKPFNPKSKAGEHAGKK